MVNEKLLKSFILLQDFGKSRKGEEFIMKTRQATIPLMMEKIEFENKSNGDILTLKWFSENKFVKAKPSEFFDSIGDKFEHIT